MTASRGPGGADGVGLGVDFSMFVVSRHREHLDEGLEPVDAVTAALATTGRAVRHSAVMVVVALAGLLLVRNEIFKDIALGASVVTVVSAVVALTLLPAVLAVLGRRVDAGPSFGRRRASSRWRAYASSVMRHRWAAAGAALATLAIVALPLVSLRLGLDRTSGVPDDLPAGRGLDLLDAHFDPGLLTPVEIVLSRPAGIDAAQLDAIGRATADLSERDGIESVVSPSTLLGLADLPATAAGVSALFEHPAAGPLAGAVLGPAEAPRTAVLFAVTGADFDSAAANRIVEDLRRDMAGPLEAVGFEVRITGATASAVDLMAEVRRAAPLVLAYLLLVSFVVLSLLFRAPVAAAKAVLMNLLGVAGAFGLLVWVFQQGHGAGIFGLDGATAIQAYLPVLALAILFGISMDYEVFLLARVREEWQRSGDPTGAVVSGLEKSGHSITLAAAIQVAVFGAFAFTSVIDVQQVGFSLAVAILLDATLVRVLLAPALMGLLGRWNWVGVRRGEQAPTWQAGS